MEVMGKLARDLREINRCYDLLNTKLVELAVHLW